MLLEPKTKATIDLKGKDLLKIADLSAEEIEVILARSAELKAALKSGDHPQPLKGKILGMIFDKSSTRTRISFEVGMIQLGGHAMFLNGQDLQIGRGETIEDTAKVMSEYVDAIMIRTFSHERVVELAKHATIPVINGLTDLYHPCQALADLLTIQEVKGKLKGLKLAYVGDGNNVANSLLKAAVKMGMDVSFASPKGYELSEDVVAKIKEFAAESGSKFVTTNNPYEAVNQADVIYTDVWTSMGQEAENEVRLQAFQNYQVNSELVKCAKEDYIFLHCLPAHREEEVTADVIDGSHSYVFQQAGNRLHAQKGLLFELLK